jgi:hypothetical protein
MWHERFEHIIMHDLITMVKKTLLKALISMEIMTFKCLMDMCTVTLVEISQNVTSQFTTTCDLYSFATRFENICNYKTNFQLFWSFSQL